MSYKADTKKSWLDAWNQEINQLYRAYQCKADRDLYERLRKAINEVKLVIEEIADKMEEEQSWER